MFCTITVTVQLHSGRKNLFVFFVLTVWSCFKQQGLAPKASHYLENNPKWKRCPVMIQINYNMGKKRHVPSIQSNPFHCYFHKRRLIDPSSFNNPQFVSDFAISWLWKSWHGRKRNDQIKASKLSLSDNYQNRLSGGEIWMHIVLYIRYIQSTWLDSILSHIQKKKSIAYFQPNILVPDDSHAQ